MRNGQLPIINNLTDAAVASSGAVYTGQYYSASFQTTFGDSTIDGTFSISVSNENSTSPSNWTELFSESITNGSKVFKVFDRYAYAYTKCVFTPATTLIQHITVPTSTGAALNNKYFTLASGGNAQKFYIWFNYEGTGTDPALPGRTGIEIPITAISKTYDIASSIATGIANAGAGALFTTVAGVDTVVITCLQYGATEVIKDYGTGYTFSVLNGGTSYVRTLMNISGV